MPERVVVTGAGMAGLEASVRARERGAAPEASYAPLVVGRGARDGETFDLDELLHMRLQDPVRP